MSGDPWLDAYAAEFVRVIATVSGDAPDMQGARLAGMMCGRLHSMTRAGTIIGTREAAEAAALIDADYAIGPAASRVGRIVARHAGRDRSLASRYPGTDLGAEYAVNADRASLRARFLLAAAGAA